MENTNKIQINKDEKKILEILQKNSNKNLEEIANNCGLTTQKLLRIKKKLEKNNIIWGYVALTDYKNISLQHFTVLFKRSTIPLKNDVIENITKGLLEDKYTEGIINIENMLYVHGDYDWIISFTAPDTLSMKKFCDKILKNYGDYIIDYSIHQTIIPIRKHGIKNPNADKQKEYLGG
jgi:DNA-binding Lrp family transcriptional regulator